MALTQKEISARHYRMRKDNGLCPRCGNPLDRKGYYCSACLEKKRKYCRENKEFYRENGICTECGKVLVPKSERICPECRAKITASRKPMSDEQRQRNNKKFSEYEKNLYRERKEQGICTRCGKRKAIHGKAKCGICLEKDAEMHRKKYFDRPNIKEYRKQNHLCYFCGKPIAVGRTICEDCEKRCSENGKKASAMNQYWRMDNRIIFKRG